MLVGEDKYGNKYYENNSLFYGKLMSKWYRLYDDIDSFIIYSIWRIYQ